MGNVIRMDLYRLLRSLSFKVCLIIVAVMSVIVGPIAKISYTITEKLAQNAENKDELLENLGEWPTEFHLGNIIAGELGTICTAVFLLCIVYFCFADIQHGYIKNVAGQLPSRGHTIISKFIVSQFTLVIFYAVEIGMSVVGQLIVGKSAKADMFYTGMDGEPDKVFGMGAAFAELGLKWLLLACLCALILLFTTGIGSNVAGTIVAILCGAGFTGLAYSGITAGLNKLFKFKDFELSRYMPDSLYRTKLNEEGLMLNALIVGVVALVLLLYCTTRLYNKKDIK